MNSGQRFSNFFSAQDSCQMMVQPVVILYGVLKTLPKSVVSCNSVPFSSTEGLLLKEDIGMQVRVTFLQEYLVFLLVYIESKTFRQSKTFKSLVTLLQMRTADLLHYVPSCRNSCDNSVKSEKPSSVSPYFYY